MRFLPGHWALGLWKIGVGAVPLLRLPFPNQRSRFVSCVGATLAVARKPSPLGEGRFPLSGGRLPLSRGDVEHSETEGIGKWLKAKRGRGAGRRPGGWDYESGPFQP